MSKVEDVARSAIAAVDSSVGLVLCSQWVAERYRQFVRRARLRHLRTVRQLTLPVPITFGTISITSGSLTVTPNSTALDAIDAVGGTIAEYYIRFAPGNTWYVVDTYNGATIHLTSVVTDATNTAATYQLVRRFHDLPADVRWTGSFVHQRMQCEMLIRTQEELNILYPGRLLIGPPPTSVAEAPRGVNGQKRVEFYPYSTQPETVHYIAWAIPPLLEYDDDIPSDVDTEMLKEGVLIDVLRWEAAKALKMGSADAAATLGNAARQQYTQWHGRDLPEATAAERAFDDVQVILEITSGTARSNYDITTARDHIWLR